MSSHTGVPSTDESHQTSLQKLESKAKDETTEMFIIAFLFAAIIYFVLISPFLISYTFTSLIAVGMAIIDFCRAKTMGEYTSVEWWYSIIWTGITLISVYFASSNVINRAWWSIVALIGLSVVDIIYIAFMYYKKRIVQLSRNIMIGIILGNVLVAGSGIYALVNAH